MPGTSPAHIHRSPQSPAVISRNIEGARSIPLIYIDPVIPIVYPEHPIPYIYGYIFGLSAGFGISKEAITVRLDHICAQSRIPGTTYI